MLIALALLMLVIWLVGMVTSFVVDGLIHILLAVAVALLVYRFLSRRSAL